MGGERQRAWRRRQQARPSQTQTWPLCTDLVRVLGEDDRAHGPWNPQLGPDRLRQFLREMALVRAFDNRMYRVQRQGKTSFYLKCTGEEATSVVATHALDSDDMIFPSYRQQGCLIARGYPLVDMVNQIFSNKADKLKGRQLPILYSAKEVNFFTISGNLTTQVPQASGFAMASAIKGDSKLGVAFVGEGSTAEGDFHSALTFNAVYNAPCIINVVNNQWAISSLPGVSPVRRGHHLRGARRSGCGIASLRVDGNDFLAVSGGVAMGGRSARACNARSDPDRVGDVPRGRRIRLRTTRTEVPAAPTNCVALPARRPGGMRLRQHLIALRRLVRPASTRP